ncbi:MAG: DnaB-like helicase N-terminal domain-containing protein [Stackebrandtia sp.]
MSALSNQAEQALVGAVLSDAIPQSVRHVWAADFGHPGYRQVYAAVLDVRESHPQLSGRPLTEAVSHRAAAPGLDADRLDELRLDAPPPEHVGAYARMVQTEAFRRQVADHAERIAAAAAKGDAGPDLKRFADALSRQVKIHAAQSTSQQTQTAEGTDMPEPGSRAAREENVLAAILQYPDQAVTLARMLPSESMTDPQRREIYETSISLAANGDPIDPTIVAWELDRSRYVHRLSTGDDKPSTARQPDVVYLHRLSGIPVNACTAVDEAETLLAEDLHDGLKTSLAAHHRQPRPTGADVAPLPLDPALKPPGPAAGTAQQPKINGGGPQ